MKYKSGLFSAFVLFWFAMANQASAARQMYEPMAESVRLAMRTSLEGNRVPYPVFDSAAQRIDWLSTMSGRLVRKVPNFGQRLALIKTIRYEAQRAGLNPQLVFAVIQVESGFQPRVSSSAGAMGLMQVMPFWADLLGDGNSQALLDPRINIRYGCVILRHYLDMERGDLDRALQRYNGSLGKPDYSNLVLNTLRVRWAYHEPESIRREARRELQASGQTTSGNMPALASAGHP